MQKPEPSQVDELSKSDNDTENRQQKHARLPQIRSPEGDGEWYCTDFSWFCRTVLESPVIASRVKRAGACPALKSPVLKSRVLESHVFEST